MLLEWIVSHVTSHKMDELGTVDIWNVVVQRSRKIPQTGGRPSSSLYGSGKNNSV